MRPCTGVHTRTRSHKHTITYVNVWTELVMKTGWATARNMEIWRHRILYFGVGLQVDITSNWHGPTTAFESWALGFVSTIIFKPCLTNRTVECRRWNKSLLSVCKLVPHTHTHTCHPYVATLYYFLSQPTCVHWCWRGCVHAFDQPWCTRSS